MTVLRRGVSPPRDLYRGRYHANACKTCVEKCAPNASFHFARHSPLVLAPLFFLPLVPVSFRGCSRSRVCPFGRTCVIYASLSGEAKIRKHYFAGGKERGEEGKEKHARGARRETDSISRNVLEGSWGRGVTITNLSRSESGSNYECRSQARAPRRTENNARKLERRERSDRGCVVVT